MSPQHALVVGASSAIGRAIATELADLDYDLTLWGRDVAKLDETRAVCAQSAGRITTDAFDLQERAGLVAAVSDPDPRLAEVALSGLAYLEAPEALQVLLDAARSEDGRADLGFAQQPGERHRCWRG